MRTTRFPLQQLRPVRATMFAHVFENRSARIRRQAFWRLRVDFRRLEWMNEEIESSIMSEFLSLPVRDWSSLVGPVFKDRSGRKFQFGWYGLDWEDTRRVEFEFVRGRGSRLRLKWSGEIDMGGYGAARANRWEAFSFEVPVRLEGLVIPAEFVPPSSKNRKQATTIAARYFDLGFLGKPVARQHEWGGRAFVLPIQAGLTP
ncbi:MAG: hypothetical protein ACKVS8_04830 [Phycisphaerales bacterium]